MQLFVLGPADTANVKGDIFTDRAVDIVNALGYEALQINTPKAGREVDVIARHRQEDRWAVFECKNEKARTGGNATNKFVGVLDAERQKHPEATGYFLSVSGFTSTAVEQEAALDKPRFVMMAAPKILSELVTGGLLPPFAQAAIRAKAAFTNDQEPDLEADVLGSEFGWAWIVYALADGERVAYTLVHGHGHLLGWKTREALRSRLAAVGIDLPSVGPSSVPDQSSACANLYERYLKAEYGYLTYDGLPADPQLQSSISLADIFVPLGIEKYGEEQKVDFDQVLDQSDPSREPTAIGRALAELGRLAILGDPGAGKSTLVRRLALACAEADDDFLQTQHFDRAVYPLVLLINCRDIGPGRDTVHELVRDIPRRAGDPDQSESFERYAIQNFEQGTAVLVVDGLDEIPSDGSRLAFVRHLAQIAATFPRLGFIVTSRKPGYKPIAGAVSRLLTTFQLVEFSQEDIVGLVAKWFELAPRHRDGQSGRALAEEILQHPRLRQLATNPLLLTTLLLVERWLGDLPKKRATLYAKAIEVLLISWNVEGHKPLNLDEALPQLGYVAHQMTEMGVQRISHSSLISLLLASRSAMPDILGYSVDGPRELLSAVESRSSLLISSGHMMENGVLQEAFEFKHLTFQEYLCASAIISGWTPNGRSQSIADALRGHLLDSRWQEVVPLVAVLSGRGAGEVVEAICEALTTVDLQPKETNRDDDSQAARGIEALGACLLDEATITPGLARRALSLLVLEGYGVEESVADWVALRNSRYGTLLADVANELFESGQVNYLGFTGPASAIVSSQLDAVDPRVQREMIDAWMNGPPSVELIGILYIGMLMYFERSQHDGEPPYDSKVEPWASIDQWLIPQCAEFVIEPSTSWLVRTSAAWTLAWRYSEGLTDGDMSIDQAQKYVDACRTALREGEGSHYIYWLAVGILRNGNEGIHVADASVERDWLKSNDPGSALYNEYHKQYSCCLLLIQTRSIAIRVELRTRLQSALKNRGRVSPEFLLIRDELLAFAD